MRLRLFRLPIWACLVAAVLSLATAAPACAETILVGPDGKPNSLHDAVRLAKDGDVIDLLAGE